MKYILLFLFIGTLSIANSQTVRLHEDVNALDIEKPKHGENMANFDHWYVDYGFFAMPSDGEGADLRYLFSHTFSFGYRYKRKLNNYFAVGTSASYMLIIYDLEQKVGKKIPDEVLHKKEKFNMNTVYGDIYFRINFGKRGNIIGKYIDFGAYGDWAFNVKNLIVDKVENTGNANSYNEVKTVRRNLNYYNPISYGTIVRIGINRYSVFGMYRISDFFSTDFKTSISKTELSRLSVGLQIGLH